MSLVLEPRPRFPVVFEHELAVGLVRGREFEAPTLPAAGPLLVARGADQLIVPAPSGREREHVEAGIAKLPSERRNLVRVADHDAEVLGRVREYLEPLVRQATKWPETAFVQFSEHFLYHLSVASNHRAGIAGGSVAAVREFIPIIDPAEFSGEARFRLAELVALICSYEPVAPDHLAWTSEVARPGASAEIWQIFDLAEFRAVVAASGKIGLVRHPKAVLRRMRRLLADLLSVPSAKGFLHLASSAADVAGAPRAVDALGSFLESTANTPQPGSFWPPFMPLGPARVGLYRAAMQQANPHATAPPGTVFAFRTTRGGAQGLSWLNDDEEAKLEREAKAGLAPRMKLLREARMAQSRFV